MDMIRYVASRERKRRKVGAEARCSQAGCGEDRIWALDRSDPGTGWLCYQHQIELISGRPRETERHHLAGLRRGPIWPMRANDHRVLTARMEHSFPRRLLRKGRSPEEEMLAIMAGFPYMSDLLDDGAPSPFTQIAVPKDGKLIVRLADVSRFVHVSGTDESYYQPNSRVPLRRLH